MLVRPLLPGSPVMLNRSLPEHDRRTGHDPALRALAAVLGDELIDWSSHIAVAGALRHLERCLPGVTIPWQVWSAFSAAGDIAQGRLRRGLLRLPVTALAPAALRQAVAELLQRCLPAFPPGMPLHEPVVLAVTACVLLGNLSRRGQRDAPQDPASVALLRIVQGLRAGLTVFGGLQRIASGVAVRPSTHRAIAGPAAAPALPPCRPGDARAHSAPLAAATVWPLQVVSPETGLLAADAPSWVTSAWPLAGTEGARSRPRARVKPQRPAGPVRPKHVVRPRRPSFQITRTAPGRRPSATPMGPAAGAGVSASGGMPSMPAAIKEPIVWGQSRYPARDAGHPPASHGRVRGPVLHQPAPDPAGDRARCPGAASTTATGRCAAATGPAHAPAAKGPGVGCLRYEPGAHLAQLARLRGHHGATLFCVQAKQQATFQATLAKAMHDMDGPWIRLHPVNETAPGGLQVRRFAGLDDRLRGQRRPLTPLDEDDLQTVLTLSIAAPQRGRATAVDAAPRLQQDSFQLIEYDAPDGRLRTFIAWLAGALASDDVAFAAGFVELQGSVSGVWNVDDVQSGLTLGGDTPSALVDALSWTSGCRYVGELTADGEPRPLRTQHVVVEDMPPAQRAALARTPAARSFFDITEFPLPGGRASVSLLRGSYTIFDDTLLFVDRAGRSATLALEPRGDDGVVLHVRTAAGGDFLAQCGLSDGQPLQRDALMQVLGDCGLAWVPPPPAPQEPETAQHDTAWYTFDGDQLRYVDAHGQRGTAWFVYRTGHARALRLADDTAAGVLAFARQLQILPATWYAEDELVWLLEGAGLTRRDDGGDADDIWR